MQDHHVHDIIVIGTSTGGVEALSKLAAGLPAGLPAAVFVVLHLPAAAPSVLPTILTRSGPLRAHHPHDGEVIRRGRIYVAPPDFHLLVERGHVSLTRGPRENRCRPAADVLFRTAALAYGPRVVGVVLTGALNDGTAGLIAVKRRGGMAVVQDPADALFPSMPESALYHVNVDHRLPLSRIPALLARLAHQPIVEEGAYPVPEEMDAEARIARMDPAAMRHPERVGEPSEYTCPECHGPLFEVHDNSLLRFRCRVGHGYTADSLLEGQTEEVEAALWLAMNTLEEGARISQQLAREARQRQHGGAAESFEESARAKLLRAAQISRLLRKGEGRVEGEVTAAEADSRVPAGPEPAGAPPVEPDTGDGASAPAE